MLEERPDEFSSCIRDQHDRKLDHPAGSATLIGCEVFAALCTHRQRPDSPSDHLEHVTRWSAWSWLKDMLHGSSYAFGSSLNPVPSPSPDDEDALRFNDFSSAGSSNRVDFLRWLSPFVDGSGSGIAAGNSLTPGRANAVGGSAAGSSTCAGTST